MHRSGSEVRRLFRGAIEHPNGTLPVVCLLLLLGQSREIRDGISDQGQSHTVFQFQWERKRCHYQRREALDMAVSSMKFGLDEIVLSRLRPGLQLRRPAAFRHGNTLVPRLGHSRAH